ncbi:MAG: outer membrane beta-barrel protein [Bacteroidaceae bacterium]|nr:outer membrane beta-barrel protein [Bacteroidaceae bacterium]
MKKNTMRAILCAMTMLAGVPAMAQETEMINTTKYTVGVGIAKHSSSEDSLYHEERNPGGFDFSLSYLREKWGSNVKEYKNEFTLEVGGNIGIGFTGTTSTPAGMSTNMGSSIEVDWSNLVGVNLRFNKNNKIGLGFGLLWRNYRMTNQTQFVQDDNGQIELASYPTGANPKFSRLHSFNLTMPLLYTHRWNNGWAITAGPELCFKTNKDKYNSIKTRYELNGEKYKDISKGVHFNPVTVNVLASVMYKSVGIYARYSPMNVLNSDFGPSFQSFTVGIRLLGW